MPENERTSDQNPTIENAETPKPVSYDGIMGEARRLYDGLQHNYFEQIYSPPLNDARDRLRALEEKSFRYAHENNVPEISALITCARTYTFRNAKKEVRKQYEDPNVFEKKFIAVLKGMVTHVLQSTDQGEVFARRKNAIQAWDLDTLQTYEEEPDESVPHLRLSEQPIITLRYPVRPGKVNKGFKETYTSTEDINNLTWDYKGRHAAGGILSTRLIVDNKEEDVEYGIFIDTQALTEEHSLEPGNEDRRTLFQRYKHRLDDSDNSRKELLWWIRNQNLPICTQKGVIQKEVFERDILHSSKRIMRPRDGYSSQEQFRKFIKVLPTELQEDLNILLALPHPIDGPFDVVSIGAHTLRMDTCFNSNPEEIDEEVISLDVQRLTNFFHDIAKGVTIALGVPNMQHDFTLAVMQKYLPEYVKAKIINEKEMDIMMAQVNHDIIGEYITMKKSLQETIDAFRKLVDVINPPKEKILGLWAYLKKFYFADSGNYQNFACEVETIMSGNKRIGRKLVLGLFSLDDIFKLSENPESGELTGEITFSHGNNTAMRKARDAGVLTEEEAHYDTFFGLLDAEIKKQYAA